MKDRTNNTIKKQAKVLESQLKALVDLQFEVAKLPPLSDVEKAKFNQMLAMDQLYYSSKLEWGELTGTMIDKAIQAIQLSTA